MLFCVNCKYVQVNILMWGQGEVRWGVWGVWDEVNLYLITLTAYWSGACQDEDTVAPPTPPSVCSTLWWPEGCLYSERTIEEEGGGEQRQRERETEWGVDVKPNVTNSLNHGSGAEVKEKQLKKVKDEIKAVPRSSAENLSMRGKATADARTRQEAKYCTPLWDLSFSADQ